AAGAARPRPPGGIDAAPGHVLGPDPKLGERKPAGAADSHLEALQIGDGLDLLAEPASHLRAGVARREARHVVVLEEIVVQRESSAVIHPRVLLTAVHAERKRAAERERRILAEEIIR